VSLQAVLQLRWAISLQISFTSGQVDGSQEGLLNS